ncbi:MAG: serine--tRNA ligase [Acidobacteria bacterium]|nr:MAG: serine--tRNA ligase [Acidobacteriota bacterium]
MLDPALFRDQASDVDVRLGQRGGDLGGQVDELRHLDTERREIIPVLEEARRAKKALGARIGQAKRDGQPADALVAAGQQHAATIEGHEERLKEVEQSRHAILMNLPNLAHDSVPVGASEADNVEVRRHGDPPVFEFQAKAHWDLGPALGIIDFERGVKLAGARFSVLMGAGARLARALINFMLELHTGEHGYVEVEPPFLANTESLTATGQLPKFEEDLFKIGDGWDLYLIPTAEVPLANLHRGEILDGRDLPLKYTAYTPCFRSEAGSYGADVRGLIRQHQFDKVELVAYTRPESSYKMLETLTGHAETVLQRLGLAYRTIVLCSGDMGFAAAKTYDIEVWLPGQQKYREISSCSNTETFQARRANIKYRPDGKGKAEHVHTLNGSGLAVGRTLIAILENNQQADGSVVIPEALRPFMGGLEIIESR